MTLDYLDFDYSEDDEGTGTFDARDFIRTGFVITLVATALLVVFALTYWPWMGYMTKTV